MEKIIKIILDKVIMSHADMSDGQMYPFLQLFLTLNKFV